MLLSINPEFVWEITAVLAFSNLLYYLLKYQSLGFRIYFLISLKTRDIPDQYLIPLQSPLSFAQQLDMKISSALNNPAVKESFALGVNWPLVSVSDSLLGLAYEKPSCCTSTNIPITHFPAQEGQ